jgi:hypothetical protein
LLEDVLSEGSLVALHGVGEFAPLLLAEFEE